MSSLIFTLIQTKLHWEDKAANLTMLQQKISSINDKTEVVILPEMFSTGFSMQPEKFAEKMDGTTVEWMRKISAEEIKLIIKKPYAREMLADLEKMDAISIQKENQQDIATLAGSWPKQSLEEIDAEIEKMRNEWERNIS